MFDSFAENEHSPFKIEISDWGALFACDEHGPKDRHSVGSETSQRGMIGWNLSPTKNSKTFLLSERFNGLSRTIGVLRWEERHTSCIATSLG